MILSFLRTYKRKTARCRSEPTFNKIGVVGVNMEFDGLKQFFGEDGSTAITYEQLSQGIAQKGIKLADLSLGGYIARDKYDEQTRKFNDYKAKNDVSKYADYEEMKSELAALRAEKADRELTEKLAAKKVKPEFQRFVLSEIKGKVTAEKPFDKAMDEYLKENGQYLVEETSVPFFKSSSVPLEGAGESGNAYSRINNQIRGVR